ncbi:hypothetical protein [Solilutibacter tolerans]|uniref:Uncharacterized protein n=1 Tax=Solilutibacter tolerans TaxID=1604334 RepID=A0A1N6N3T1_9GAMM|nr:hypothetical protein [Lysobacter tolerans]SIP86734.1 hypothetical protein SAMN05421546_0070 [Lysobacter tolerans]
MSDIHRPPENLAALEHSVPMRCVDSVLLAWEALECSQRRRELEVAIHDGLIWAHGDWEAVGRLAAPIFHAIDAKVGNYQVSMHKLMQRRRLSPTRDLDEAIRQARKMPPGDRLVCHVGMYKAYSTLSSIIRMQTACIADPAERLQGISIAFRQHALKLYDAQRLDWQATVADHAGRGRMLEAVYPLPNPFGIVPGIPCWQLMPRSPLQLH